MERAGRSQLKHFMLGPGWQDPCVGCSFESDHVNGILVHLEQMAEMSGRSIFYKDATGAIFHTYSSFARGGEVILSVHALLDMTPKGRNETGRGNLTAWVRRHDRYEGDR